MSTGKLLRFVESDEPLRIVGMSLAVIRHSDQTSTKSQRTRFCNENSPVKLQATVDFIAKGLAVDALSAHTCPGRVTGLDDEALHNAMEDNTIIVAWLDQYRSEVKTHLPSPAE